MELVNRIRDNQKNMSTDDAINAAIESCIEDGIMTEFLIKYRAEVFSVCITEFDEKVYTDGIREEGREEGRKAGHAEILEIIRLIKAGATDEDIVNRLHCSLTDIQEARTAIA